jgi:hypothetical protein
MKVLTRVLAAVESLSIEKKILKEGFLRQPAATQ